jgi:hypothetical protein
MAGAAESIERLLERLCGYVERELGLAVSGLGQSGGSGPRHRGEQDRRKQRRMHNPASRLVAAAVLFTHVITAATRAV